MPEHPLLILPRAASVDRAKRGGGGGDVSPLSPSRQADRLGPRLVELEEAFENRRMTAARDWEWNEHVLKPSRRVGEIVERFILGEIPSGE